MMRKSAEAFITSRNLHKPPPPPNKNSNEDSPENHKKAFRFHEQIFRDSSKPLDFSVSARDRKRKSSIENKIFIYSTKSVFEAARNFTANQSPTAIRSIAFSSIENSFSARLLKVDTELLVHLVHIEYQRGELVVHHLTAVTPCLLNVEINSQRKVNVVEIDFLGIVEHLQEARCDKVTVKRETSVFSEEIIVTVEAGLNENRNAFLVKTRKSGAEQKLKTFLLGIVQASLLSSTSE